jgi:hypothetical protein
MTPEEILATKKYVYTTPINNTFTVKYYSEAQVLQAMRELIEEERNKQTQEPLY